LKLNHYFQSAIVKTLGFTRDPKLDDYILVMQYAPEGNLHKYLQKEFTEINWQRKLSILRDILSGYLYFKYIDSN
jgi:serine/threonine protein kinase